MPISKNFDIRRKILDRLIAKRVPTYSRQQLFEKLNDILFDDEYPEISFRQFNYDIDEMKLEALKAGGELKYSRSGKQYYYEPEGFSLTGVPIQQKDIELLTQAIAILKQINGLSSTREIELIIERLAEKIGVQVNDLDDIIVFDMVPDLKGIDHLHTLLNCIIQKQPIVLHYKPFNKDAFSYIFHPYFLKEFNNRWYVFGWNEEYEEIYNVPLDRIVAYEDATVQYDESHRVSIHEYFKDIIGVTRRNAPVEELVYKFKMPRGYYVLTKPLHPSQEVIKQTKDMLIVKISVIPNKELEAVINSFGEDVEAI